jgi:hypothetical protein
MSGTGKQRETVMEKNVAVRIDGMLCAIRANLDFVAGYMKRNLSDEEYKKYIHSIGRSMGATIEISNDLHQMFPDIVPKELCSEPAKDQK